MQNSGTREIETTSTIGTIFNGKIFEIVMKMREHTREEKQKRTIPPKPINTQ